VGIQQHDSWKATGSRRGSREARPSPGRPGLAPLAALLLAVALGCGGSVEERLEEARSLQELGALEESEDELRAILEEQPDHPEANYLLGMAQLRLGQPTLAVWPLQIARRDEDLAVKAGVALGGTYLQLEQTELAIEAATQVLAAPPERPEDRVAALRLRAGAFMREKRHEEALADANQLVEIAPDDPQAMALRANALLESDRPEEARDALHAIWENASPETASAAARAGIGLVQLYRDELEDPEAAREQLEAVLERYPADRNALRYAVEYYGAREQGERAEEVLRGALEAAPLDLELRAWVAHQLAERGRGEEGEEILAEATELEGSATAWLNLSEFRRQRGDLDGALAAMERTVELASPPSDVLLFRYADLLASNGELDRAEGLAEELTDSVYREILLGRIAFERDDYARAFELLDQGLRRWPNNVGARYLAGRSAYALGKVDRALSEFQEAMRVEIDATDAALDAARLHLARGEGGKAIQSAARLWNAIKDGEDPRVVEALRLVARAQLASGRLEDAQNTLRTLAAEPGGVLPAVLEQATLLAKVKGPAAAAEQIAATELDLTDPEHAEGLRALSQYLVEAGQPQAALSRVEAALERHPDEAVLHDMRGRVLFNAGRPDEARQAFERAVELDADSAVALEGLARVAQAEGDAERALELFDRAAEAGPEHAGAVYAGAQIALRSGDAEEAERRLRAVLRRDPLHAEASNDLAWILAERGEELDLALRLAQQAASQRRTANVLDTLGWVQIRRGEARAAVATLEEAHELAPGSPSIAYRLGRALTQAGDTGRARQLLEEALEAGAFPEHERAREELARLTAADS